MPTICAWCKPPRKISEFPMGIETHGICRECKKMMLEELQRRYEEGKQRIKAVELKKKAQGE